MRCELNKISDFYYITTYIRVRVEPGESQVWFGCQTTVKGVVNSAADCTTHIKQPSQVEQTTDYKLLSILRWLDLSFNVQPYEYYTGTSTFIPILG